MTRIVLFNIVPAVVSTPLRRKPSFAELHMSTPSNGDRLEAAGILDDYNALTQEQKDAIDSLTSQEVTDLIDVNTKLADQIERKLVGDETFLRFPGRSTQ